jgi:phage shock protein C
VQQRRLTLSHNRWIAGVCGGIAEYFGWSALATRIVFVVISVLSAAFPGILVYIVLWAAMPSPPPRFNLDDFRQQ